MKKKFGATLLLAALTLSCTMMVSAAEDEGAVCGKQAEPGHVREVDVLENYIPNDINDLCNVKVTRSASISVPVTEPCDQSWRSKYPSNWMWQANRAVTRADDELTSRYGIYYYSVAQKEWTSNNTTTSALVQEAKNEFGLTNGAKLMIAFTGRTMSDGTMGEVLSIGGPYAVIVDSGYADNSETVQHETGHCYGLRHISGDNSCVMTAAGMGHIGQICTTHNNQWNSNKNKY